MNAADAHILATSNVGVAAFSTRPIGRSLASLQTPGYPAIDGALVRVDMARLSDTRIGLAVRGL
jgi:hypothetical protein